MNLIPNELTFYMKNQQQVILQAVQIVPEPLYS